jgi:hypothetical protein
MVEASSLPIMKKHCGSCPFKKNSKGYWQDVELASQVTARTLFKGHQICHGTEGENRKANNRCKGSFENNYEIYKRLGYAHLVK